MTFPKIRLAPDLILKKTGNMKLVWMSFPEIGQAHASEICQ